MGFRRHFGALRVMVFFAVSGVVAFGGAPRTGFAETTVTYAPQTVAKPPISPLETLSPSDQAQALKMSETYARHLYNTRCFESSKAVLSRKDKAGNPLKTPEKLQKSCDCMADFMLSRYAPYDISAYITKNFGQESPETVAAKPKLKMTRAILSKEQMQFAEDWRDPVAQKKCGMIP